VQTELATSTESRMTLQNSELTLDSNNKEKVEKKFTESKHKFDDLNSLISTSKLSGKTSTVISAYIAQTNQYITDAEYLFKQEQFPLALAKLQQVDQLVSDAEAIVNADVSTSVALKFIVNEAFSNATTTFDIKADIIATSTATTTLDIPSATSTEASSTTN
jgi:hypothetical protein